MSHAAPPVRPTRAEINLGHVAHNVRAVREALGGATRLYGVVKADGYGHGAAEVGAAMVRAGADGLCVALVEEGISLRERGLRAPVIALSGLHRDGLEAALAHDVTPVVHDPSQLDELARVSSRRQVTIHLKVDTGMSRLGVTLDELPAVARRLASMPGVHVAGVMTHFANADLDDPGFCEVQLARFGEARATLSAEGIHPPIAHAANSAAALRLPATRLDLVRVGVALYGVAPFPNDGGALLPVMRVRTEVLARRVIAAGTAVGYAGAWRAGRRTVLATIPIGYADGYFRRLSSEAEVLVHGGRARVVGNVSMDLCTVDVTEVDRVREVQVGDEVVLLGAQTGPAGFGVIRAEEIAARVGTIPYEVLTALSRRVPRVFAP
jgi:alanine racemase